MTERQISFFRSLLAPFSQQAYYNMRGFTYVKSQTIENRLDDVAGPLGWTAEFTETKGGYKCRLKILCPDHTEDGWAWHYKENGAGSEDMVKLSHGETVPDEDNSEKSAYTNSFKRAASKWGFGRDLYNCGMPAYCADLYTKSNKAQADPRIEPRVFRDDEKERVDKYQRQTYADANSPDLRTKYQPKQLGQRQVHLNPPTDSRQAFPWVKNIEKHYGTELLSSVNKFCKDNFQEWKLGNLDDQQVEKMATWVIGQIKTWPQYDGYFDQDDQIVGDRHIAEVGPSGPMGAVVDAILNDSSRTPRGNIKRAIIAAAKAAIFKQTGREGRENEIMAFVGDVAAGCKNSLGIQGEVLMSLKACDDDIWLSNILDNAKHQMIQSAALREVVEKDTDNPF
jgi:hypothetical protein